KPGKTAPVSVVFQRSDPEAAKVPVEVADVPTKTPDTKTPDTKTPDIKTPDTKTPDTKTPDAPALWEAVITSAEPGVEIFLDGKSRGMAPVTVKDLAAGKTYEFTAKKSGFETQAFS